MQNYALQKMPAVTPLESALNPRNDPKSSRMCTYRKRRGEGYPLRLAFTSPSPRASPFDTTRPAGAPHYRTESLVGPFSDPTSQPGNHSYLLAGFPAHIMSRR